MYAQVQCDLSAVLQVDKTGVLKYAAHASAVLCIGVPLRGNVRSQHISYHNESSAINESRHLSLLQLPQIKL
jgi:hypothetical protein